MYAAVRKHQVANMVWDDYRKSAHHHLGLVALLSFPQASLQGAVAGLDHMTALLRVWAAQWGERQLYMRLCNALERCRETALAY